MTTGSLERNGEEYHVICNSTKLGFFAVFMSEGQSAAQTTSSSSTLTRTTSGMVDETEKSTLSDSLTTAAEVEISFQVDFKALLPDETAEMKFKRQVIENLMETLTVDSSRITNLSIRKGSIIVSFILLAGGAGETNITRALGLLETAVKANDFRIVLGDGRKVVADPSSFTFKYTDYSSLSTAHTTSAGGESTEEPANRKENSALSSGALAGTIAAAIAIVAVATAGIAFYICKQTSLLLNLVRC